MPIEYAPQSWNPYSGCRHALAQCPVVDKCWARSMAHRFSAAAGGDFEPRVHPERLEEPFHWRKPRRVAVSFMGDLFGEWVDGWVIDRILKPVVDCPQHTFLFLTKHPSRLAEFSPWPSNAWVGASAWDIPSVNQALIQLGRVDTFHTWISFEPLLHSAFEALRFTGEKRPGWVVIGGLARGRQDPNLAQWVNDLAQECRRDEIPYWEKSNLAATLNRPLRQELPQVEG